MRKKRPSILKRKEKRKKGKLKRNMREHEPIMCGLTHGFCNNIVSTNMDVGPDGIIILRAFLNQAWPPSPPWLGLDLAWADVILRDVGNLN